MRRRGRQRRLSAGAHERPGGEHRQTVAAEALNGVADAASDETGNRSPKSRRCGDEIGHRDKMNEPRQSESLLGDIEMRRRGLAKARRKTPLAGHDQRRGGHYRRAQRKRP